MNSQRRTSSPPRSGSHFSTPSPGPHTYCRGCGTLVAAFYAVILGLVFGIALGMGRLSNLQPIRWACGIFVEFFRAVPVLMMMAPTTYSFGFQISGDNLSLYGVVAGLTFYNASVIAELIRSGVGSLPKGQREAGLAIGSTPFGTLWHILLPRPSP